ncbi:hypothetical protein N9Q21_02670 [Flavobacteriaceae bacterium]|nr:hypothetical protein [Flavobacteriaceae bacterium]
MKIVFDNSGMPIDYEKDISEQFNQVFKDLKNFSKPMAKILDGGLADKIESNRILDQYKLLLEMFYKNYIEETRHWWPGEPYSGMPMIGPNEELANMFGPSNDIFKATLVVTARINLEKLLVQQLKDLPRLRKHIGE